MACDIYETIAYIPFRIEFVSAFYSVIALEHTKNKVYTPNLFFEPNLRVNRKGKRK